MNIYTQLGFHVKEFNPSGIPLFGQRLVTAKLLNLPSLIKEIVSQFTEKSPLF